MPPEDQQETSMRDDMETAILTIENDESEFTTETQAAAAEGGEFNAESQETETQTTDEAQGEEAAGDPAADELAETSDAPTDDTSDNESTGKPPASWPPAAREEWGKLPESIRAQVSKRETEINRALNDGAENRKTGEAFKGISDRYAQVFAAEGATSPIQGIEELVKTVASLQMGSAQQKAERIAGFIKHYGVDIGTLDNVLSGQIGGGSSNAQADPVEQMLNERLKPVDAMLQRMDQQQRQQQYEANQRAVTEVQTFSSDPQNEFYHDVKNDMADMVEMAEKRGYTMPLQEAYDKACALNPEIKGILDKRTADAALLNGQQTLADKQNAASSIVGKVGGGPAQNDDMSLRESLDSALAAYNA